MEKLLNHLRNASLLAAMIFLFSAAAKAQPESTTTQPAVTSPDDPIVSMLDSLVNQNYIQRLTICSTGNQQNNFQPSEVPSYTQDVYRKRIQNIQTPIPLAYNAQVQEYIDLYSVRKRALTERVMGLANLYFPLYEQILDQQELPLEFKYLSIVESALNPVAVSRVGATGLWQFMLNTGKLYNLKINSFIDERRDPYKSTMAACQYFKDMYNIYHDWLLVIAAYNCGAGNVNKAIMRSGGKTNFWEISKYLPRETRGYVPAFIAVTYLMNYSAEHNLSPVSPIVSYFDADTVMVSHKISLGEIADAINVPVDLLSFLNPVYRKGIIPQGTEPCVLKLPTCKMNTYLAKVDGIYKLSIEQETVALKTGDEYDSQLYTSKVIKKYHQVKKGEKLSVIADLYDCTTQDIKYWNKLRSSKLHTGQKLLVMVTVHEKKEQNTSLKPIEKDSMAVGEPNADNQTSDSALTSDQNENKTSDPDAASSLSKVKFVYHIVQPGDTLWNIAKRYEGVTVENLKAINQLNSNELKPGTKLKVIIGG